MEPATRYPRPIIRWHGALLYPRWVALRSEPALSHQGSRRMSSLDGLRGVAAFVVLIRHSVMLIPSVSDESAGSQRKGLVWWFTYTPLHVLWAGPEAVVVFFVLSGFVLTRAADSRSFSWSRYYPSRLLRLYLPVLGALAFGAATIALIPRPALGNGAAWFSGQRFARVTTHGFLHELILIRGPGRIDPPLWSLRWEVLFSLLLPLAVYGATRRPRLALLSAAVLLALPLANTRLSSAQGGHYLLYLPMFGIGALMAHNHEALVAVGRRLSGATGAFVCAAGLALLILAWLARDQSNQAYRPAEIAGAALLVFTFGYWRNARTAGESPPLQWLGKRSFSLYLIHFPIVMAAAYSLGENSRFGGLIAVPVALAVAEIFYRVVERPSHRLSQHIKAAHLRRPASAGEPVVRLDAS
jgi:peptidoglycan/LPS O-acetylase OafA/YrhL